MSNCMRLNSEGFEQAASILARSMDSFNTDSFQESVLMFKRSVDKYQEIAGMQAENELRASKGLAQAYDERAFKKVKEPEPKVSTTNITTVMIRELARLRKFGFNGIRFHECHMGMDPKVRIKDFLSDGLTHAQADENVFNYCTIVINPDFEGDEGIPEDTEYRETINNSYKFYDDFNKHLKTVIGEDITITEPRPSCEFEITRMGYKWPHS